MEIYSLEETLRIAKAQKGILWCILASLICIFFLRFGLLILLPIQIYYVYKLASSLRAGLPALWVLGMLVPLLSLILLMVLSSRATGAIRTSGFRVGLMGAKIREITDKMRFTTEPQL